MGPADTAYDLVRQIPVGKVVSYATLARKLKIHPRTVGRILSRCPDPDQIPCYRVVHADGRVGGYKLGVKQKIRRLEADNIQVKAGRVLDFGVVFQELS